MTRDGPGTDDGGTADAEEADEFAIRRFEAGEAACVREVHEVTMRAEGAYVDPAALPDDVELDADLRAIEATYLDGGGEFLVGERDGEVVATGAFLPVDAATAEITRMRVLPDHQGQGYGRRMLTALEADAVERGFDTFVLDTLARLTAARNLYESAGYRETNHETRGEYEQIFYRKTVGDG